MRCAKGQCQTSKSHNNISFLLNFLQYAYFKLLTGEKHEKGINRPVGRFLKVYTEGFRVLLLNRRVIGCKSINLHPIV